MRLIFALLIASACFAQTVVSNILAETLVTGAVRVTFDTDGAFTQGRARYAEGTGTCAAGTATDVIVESVASATRAVNVSMSISGLRAATQHCIAPEVFSGGSWSTGVELVFTTPAAGSDTPTAPTAVGTTFPTPNGVDLLVPFGDCDNVTTGFAARLVTATADLALGFGDNIKIPPLTECPGLYTLPTTGLAKTFQSTAVDTANSRLTLPSHGWAEDLEIRFGADLESTGGCLPGTEVFKDGQRCDYGVDGGWREGHQFKVHVIDTNTIEVRNMDGTKAVPGWLPTVFDPAAETVAIHQPPVAYLGIKRWGDSAAIDANREIAFVNVGGALPTSTPQIVAGTVYYNKTACSLTTQTYCTFQISTTMGGAAINFTGTGSGITYLVGKGLPGINMHVAPAPDQAGQRITITTTDTTMPPDGTQFNAENDSRIPFFTRSAPYPTLGYTPGIRTSDLAFNYRFHNVGFKATANTDYLTTIDPRADGNFFDIQAGAENIIFDQVHLKCLPYPQRCGGQNAIVASFNGRNAGFINSINTDVDYFHVHVLGLAPSVAGGGTIARLASGLSNSGPSIYGLQQTASNVDFTVAGGTGTIKEYFSMTGVLTVLATTGITGSFTSCVGITCAFSTTATPAFPTVTIGGSVRKASCNIATFTVTAGVVSAPTNNQEDCKNAANINLGTEGSSLLAGVGPGPLIFDNSLMSGTGVPLHYDDSANWDKKNYSVKKSRFYANPAYCLGNAASNGLRYWNRNLLEWKGGQRILVEGTLFSGQCSDKSSASVSIAVTPRNGGAMSDIDFSYNWFMSGSGGFNACSVQSSPVIGPPCSRQSYTNNLFQLNAWDFHSPDVSFANGWAMSGFAWADGVKISNNTYWRPTGLTPTFTYFDTMPIRGMVFENNAVSVSGGAGGAFLGEFIDAAYSAPACGNGTFALAAANCTWVQGIGVPGYTFGGNANMLMYTNTYETGAPFGDMTRSTGCTRWGGTYVTNCGAPFIGSAFLNAGTAVLREAEAGYIAPNSGNFRLSPSSPLVGTGTAGSNIGVDFNELLNRAGIVRDIVITPGASTMGFSYTAPDTKNAWVGISADAGATWTYTLNAGIAGTRTATLTGLTASTAYMCRVLDYSDQTAALNFTSGQITTQTCTTTAPPPNGVSSFRGSGIRGVLR